MGFLDMGLWEIGLILAIALIIFGPARIPEIARTLGKTVRALRKATSDLTTTVTRELNMEEEKDRPPRSETTSSDKPKEPSDADKTESGGTETAVSRDQ